MYQGIKAQISGAGHIQGIAIDQNREYIYCSFTTVLIKMDLKGQLIGTVTGLAGHLGCIAYNMSDGCVYGSLEYKHDCIGTGILKQQNSQLDFQDGFYIAIFDVSKINRIGMDSEKDEIMTTVYLNEVASDYTAINHRYGCSGIDGTTFGPDVENPGNKKFLYVAYGIYSDTEREDNNYQVILKYDIEGWNQYKMPLSQENMHKSGPQIPDGKYFVYTGNTTFGIQNLEYDPYTNSFLAAVYRGSKPNFKNYSLFMIDASIKPQFEMLKGTNEVGKVLRLSHKGLYDKENNIYGWQFEYGATGLIALGDGYYYISHDWNKDPYFGSEIKRYRWDGKSPFQLCESLY